MVAYETVWSPFHGRGAHDELLSSPYHSINSSSMLRVSCDGLDPSLWSRNSTKGGEEDVTTKATRIKDARSEGDRDERELAFDLFLLEVLGVII